MKNLLSAALIVAATSVAASAADMSMPYKAAPMPQSVYNWTGFYLGGTAGGGLGNSEHLDQDALSSSDTKFQQAFGTLGVTGGYNYQFGSTVLGIEGDFNWANVDKTKSIASDRFEEEIVRALVLPDTNTTRFQMDEFATLRGRAGLALDRTLVYATAGVAFAHIQNTTQLGAFNAIASEDKWKTGIAVGGGVEFAFTQNWTLRGEYLLMQFQNSNAGINDAGGAGNVCGTTFPCRMNYSESIQTARVGLNYKFGN
jgi:outer membrane immunogenic protein